MKCKFLAFVSFLLMLVLLPGCDAGNFADISSAMSTPALTNEQNEIEKITKEHFGGSFKWIYPFVDGKYAPSLECNISAKNCTVLFCQSDNEISNSHILLLEKNKGKWIISDSLIENNFEINKVKIKRDSNSVFFEMIIEGVDLTSLSFREYTYQIRDNKILKI